MYISLLIYISSVVGHNRQKTPEENVYVFQVTARVESFIFVSAIIYFSFYQNDSMRSIKCVH